MSCQPFERFLLDETAPKPDGHDAHVAGCASCRALKAAHLAALRLGGLAPRRGDRVPLAVVQRRAGIAAAVVLVLGGFAGLLVLEGSSVPDADVAPALRVPALVVAPPVVASEGPQQVLPAAGPVDEAWATLRSLPSALAADLTRDLRDDEVLSRSFGALPGWVAPVKSHPLRGLGAAAPRLSYTSED